MFVMFLRVRTAVMSPNSICVANVALSAAPAAAAATARCEASQRDRSAHPERSAQAASPAGRESPQLRRLNQPDRFTVRVLDVRNQLGRRREAAPEGATCGRPLILADWRRDLVFYERRLA